MSAVSQSRGFEMQQRGTTVFVEGSTELLSEVRSHFAQYASAGIKCIELHDLSIDRVSTVWLLNKPSKNSSDSTVFEEGPSEPWRALREEKSCCERLMNCLLCNWLLRY